MNRVVVKNLLWQVVHNRFLGVALLLILGGMAAGCGSIVSLARFFRDHMPITRDLSAPELLQGVIVPHVGLLFCIAMIGYGVFLLRRSDIWRFLIVVGRKP